MMHRLQRYGTVNSKRHPRNLILGCLFVSSSFHSVPSSALCFAKSQEVDPSRSRRNLIVSLMLGSLGQIDLIVTKEVSRFTRNTVDALQITRELRRRGVGVLFLNDSLDTRTNDGELRLTIMSSVAQDESRKTSERSKWGQTRSMEKGVVFGGSLLGYDVIGGKMTVNPEGAEVVRLIFHKYLQEHKGCSTIARELREAGILSSKGSCPMWPRATLWN